MVHGALAADAMKGYDEGLNPIEAPRLRAGFSF